MALGDAAGGGGGGFDRDGGGRGAATAGGGGGADGGGGGDADEGGGGGAVGGGGAETFRVDVWGAGGFTPGSGGGREGVSGADLVEIYEIEDEGLPDVRGGIFRKFATRGFSWTCGGPPGVGGGGRPLGSGGGGALPVGVHGPGFRELSESERYEASALAPVSIPPRFLSLGMPPANNPPNCGAEGIVPLS